MMSDKMKKLLCQAGYFERLPREDEAKLHSAEFGVPEGVFCWYNNGPGPAFYGYYVDDEKIEWKDAELFLRQKHYRTMKTCAVICTVCLALIALAIFL